MIPTTMKTNVFDFCARGEWDYDNHHNFEGLIASLRVEFEYLGEGRNRIVFARNECYVIKAPKSILGLDDNWHEASTCLNKNHCKAKLLHNVLLVMERVTPVENTLGLPSWTYHIDCAQVGITRRGKLKAYDFGLH